MESAPTLKIIPLLSNAGFSPCSLFPVPCSLFPAPSSLLPPPISPRRKYLTELKTAVYSIVIIA
ncbi:hypothetical protein [Moorena sp. SIO3H5]|uniref:hypothetical protein n=1 Tax=Moorena sp. SIO3H5 TaxID=2607834 RepID=UPI0025D353AD|nr:hypothetical protein [Moorena sp. SIO3H5]